MKKLILILLVLLSACSKEPAVAVNPNLEAGLIKALKLKPGTTARLGDSGKALRAYIKEGYMDVKPTQRADYTDYRVLKKPALLMGHTLVLVEEEYMTTYVGCCVSPGVGVTMSLSGSSEKLEKFAAENGCSFRDAAHTDEEFKTYGLSELLPKGKYVSLSCRERDAQAADQDHEEP